MFRVLTILEQSSNYVVLSTSFHYLVLQSQRSTLKSSVGLDQVNHSLTYSRPYSFLYLRKKIFKKIQIQKLIRSTIILITWKHCFCCIHLLERNEIGCKVLLKTKTKKVKEGLSNVEKRRHIQVINKFINIFCLLHETFKSLRLSFKSFFLRFFLLHFKF